MFRIHNRKYSIPQICNLRALELGIAAKVVPIFNHCERKSCFLKLDN